MAKRGPASAAELDARAAFRKTLPKLDAQADEKRIMAFVQKAMGGYLEGLLTGYEFDALQKAAALCLRALRQRHAREDVNELEALYEKVDALEKRASSRGAAERNKTR